MPPRRTYGDSCGIARALDLVGERWALLIARELLLGPKRFTDLRHGLPGVSPDVLAQRLRELEAARLIERRRLPPPAAAQVYALSGRGSELEPVLVALGRWGSQVTLPTAPAPLSADALAVALKAMYALPAGDDGRELRVELALGEDVFAVRARAKEIEIGRHAATDGRSGDLAPSAISTDTVTLAGIIWHGDSLEAALRSGALALSGDRDGHVQFLTRFGGPATAAAAAE